ncbi:MAG TPA: hypothetical protein VNA13_02740 [Xanthomonadales bacterium]|nr:hypothetical protein [Xanthomonadales bacterium]
MSNFLLSLTVKDPNKLMFKGEVLSITSLNNKGKFDVLPYHANFISLIKDFLIVREKNKKEITIPLKTGVIRVNNDNVNILIGV